MAQQILDFNINNLSAEGAGKVYEVLADNAGKKAQGAAEDKQGHLNEYGQSMAQYERFKSASENTMAQSVATKNAAVVGLNAANDRLSRSNVRSNQANIRIMEHNHSDLIGLVNALESTGNYIKAAEIKAKTLEGQMASLKDSKEDVKRISAGQGKQVAKEMEAFMVTLKDNPDDGFLRGYATNYLSNYKPAVEDAEAQRVNSVATSYMALYREAKGNISPAKREKLANQNGVNKAWLKDIEYIAVNEEFDTQLAQATSFGDVQKIEEERAKVNEERYNDVHILKSKADKTKAMVKESKTQSAKALKLAYSNIKENGERMFIRLLDNTQMISTDQAKVEDVLERTIADMQLKPIAADARRKEFNTKYVQDGIDDQAYEGDNQLTEKNPYYDMASKGTKEQLDKQLGDRIVDKLLRGTPEEFTSAFNANPNRSKAVGAALSKRFREGDTTDKMTISSRIYEMVSVSGDGRVLSQSLENKDFAYMLNVGLVADSLGGNTEEEVKANYKKAEEMVANSGVGNKAQLTPSSNKDMYSNMSTDAGLMGDNAGNFLYTIKAIYANNPTTAVDNYEMIREHYMGLSNVETLTFGSGDHKIAIDEAMAPNPFKKLPEDMQTTSMEKALEEGRAKFIAQYGREPQFTTIKFTSDSRMVLKDWMGSTEVALPIGDFIEGEKGIYLMDKQIEGERRTEVAKALNTTSGKEVVNDVAETIGADNINDAMDYLYETVFPYWEEVGGNIKDAWEEHKRNNPI